VPSHSVGLLVLTQEDDSSLKTQIAPVAAYDQISSKDLMLQYNGVDESTLKFNLHDNISKQTE